MKRLAILIITFLYIISCKEKQHPLTKEIKEPTYIASDSGLVIVDPDYNGQGSVAKLEGGWHEDGIKDRGNVGTVILHNRGTKDHYVVYVSGEAYLETRPVDKALKIITGLGEAPNGNVEILNAKKINLRSNPLDDAVRITNYEGTPEIRYAGNVFWLQPGERLVLNLTNGYKENSFPEYDTAWLHGEWAFNKMPLHYILKAIRTQYRKYYLTFEDCWPSELHSGHYQVHDLSLDDILKRVCGKKYNFIVEDSSIIISK